MLIRVWAVKIAFALLLAALAWPMAGCESAPVPVFKSDVAVEGARVWVGPQYWANRLQDWRVVGDRIEVHEDAEGLAYRTLHLLTRRLADRKASFEISVTAGTLTSVDKLSPNAAAGLLIGAGAGMDYRGAALTHWMGGRGAGLFAGIDGRGRLVIRDLENIREDKTANTLAQQERGIGAVQEVRLVVRVKPESKHWYRVELRAVGNDGKTFATIKATVPADRVVGNVALVSHSGAAPATQRKNQVEGRGRFWFRDWQLAGPKFDTHDDRRFGPIVSAQHTLSNGTLKLTAQFMPLGESDTPEAHLQIAEGVGWRTVATETIRRDSYTATFRVEDWDDTGDRPYRVAYELKRPGGVVLIDAWTGTIRKDPADKRTFVVAAFTGNHNNSKRLHFNPYDWKTGTWFPHQDVVDRVALHQPDLLFFSGDQVYEGLSPTFADRQHLHLDYLYKWYLWCWAYRELARDIPCITIPDDHDVYQGNIWGEGGRKTDVDNKGGYVHPADFVKMVEHTQCDNLPDPFDPTPVEQGIGVYYTGMTYGRVGFAVLEDRKFKSGCNGRIEGKTRGRPDHINDPSFDISKADAPGLKLLGDRQLEFLDEWAADWEDQDMKVALSQTVFANMATHHGASLFSLIADLDSNGWPQSGRNRAIAALRRGYVFHIAGDQHLASLVHHGIDEHDDAIWSFCVPSVANFYPRAWMPARQGTRRERGMSKYMGRNRDGFGNLVTVYATTNPVSSDGKTGVASPGREPLELHDGMPGYGIVKLDKVSRDITVECWPRYAVPGRDRQYPGWPRIINQFGNYGRQPAAWLPTMTIENMTNPVVQVIEDATGEVVYTVRIKGNRFKPHVFNPGAYTVKVGEPAAGRVLILKMKSNNSPLEEIGGIRIP